MDIMKGMGFMKLERQRAFIIRFVFILILLILVYVGIKYVFPLLMPFILGMIVAVSFRHVIDKVEKKTHIKRTFISIVLLLVFYGILGFILSMIGIQFFGFISSLFKSLPATYQNSFLPALQIVTNDISDKWPEMKPYLDTFVKDINMTIFNYISNVSSKVVSTVTGIASQVPTLLIKLIFTIVSSFFFTIDYYKISGFFMSQFSEARKPMIIKMKNNVTGTLGKFAKAYTTIILITFVELSLGFWIMGIPTPYLFGGLVAIIDIMPILGTGAVIIPWSIIAFILGNTKIGAGMLILYITITVVRQVIEPKIVGQQIGLHPIVTLILMYVGAQLMGLLGLLTLPILATILVKLDSEGSIYLFRHQNTEKAAESSNPKGVI